MKVSFKSGKFDGKVHELDGTDEGDVQSKVRAVEQVTGEHTFKEFGEWGEHGGDVLLQDGSKYAIEFSDCNC